MHFSKPQFALIDFASVPVGAIFFCDLRIGDARKVVAALKIDDGRGAEGYVVLSEGPRPGGRPPLRQQGLGGFAVLLATPHPVIELPTSPADFVLGDENTQLALILSAQDVRLITQDEHYYRLFDVVSGHLVASQPEGARICIARWKIVIRTDDGGRHMVCEVNGPAS